MARPANTPRLRDIDPSALARDIAGRVLDHIVSQAMSLVSVDAIPSLPNAEQTEIYRVVRALAGYARGDHGLDAPVQEYLISLGPLYLAVIGQTGEPDGEELTTELGVVIHAAAGRAALERKPPRGLPAPTLSTLQLAALGGMAQRAVAALCRAGELEAEQDDNGWRVSAKEARRWLATRAP
jgi:hypothetical protein